MNIKSFNYQFVAAPRANSKKLMIVLHGLGDSASGYYWLPRELDFDNLNYLFLNAPDEYLDGYSWYDFAEDHVTGARKHKIEGIERSLNLLFDLLAELEAEGWQSENIFLFGFSQGCLMSLEVGFHYKKQLAGICGISGYLANDKITKEQIEPQALKQNWLFTHGNFDELIPVKKVEADVTRLNGLGLQIEFHKFDKTHTIDGYEELPLIKAWLKKLIG